MRWGPPPAAVAAAAAVILMLPSKIDGEDDALEAESEYEGERDEDEEGEAVPQSSSSERAARGAWLCGGPKICLYKMKYFCIMNSLCVHKQKNAARQAK